MDFIFETLPIILAILSIILFTSLPYFIIFYFQLEHIKNKKLIKDNPTISIEAKKLYNNFLNDNNFKKQSNDKLLNLISLSSKFVLILYTIIYITTLVLFWVFKDNILYVFAGYFIIMIILLLFKFIYSATIDIKHPINESYYEKIITPFIQKLFPNYTYSLKSNAVKEDYKFTDIKPTSKEAFYNYKNEINYHINKNNVTIYDLNIETFHKKINHKTDNIQERVNILFHGVYGKMELDKKSNLRNIVISSTDLLEYKAWDNIEGLEKYKFLYEDKENLKKKLTPDIINKLNNLVKKYKFDFYINDGKILYFRVTTYNHISSTNINEEDFIASLIKNYNLYKEIELVLNEFLNIDKYM